MATAWIVLTADDLNDYSVGAKVNALRTAALAAGQADPFTKVMTDIVAVMRAQIGSSGKNQVSLTANSLPPECKIYGCWLVIEAMQARLPGLSLKDEEKAMIDHAHAYMKSVAGGTTLVSEPVDPIDAGLQSGGSISVVSAPARKFTRETLDAL